MERLAQLFDFFPQGKLLLPSITAIFATAADAMSSAASWENFTVKGVLVAIVIYMSRQLEKERGLLAKEREERRLERDKREEFIASTLERLGVAIERANNLTEESTGYFRAVTRNIVDERMGKKNAPVIP